MTYRHVVVVGGTSGIGRELARQLAESGAKVAVLGRSGAPEVGETLFVAHDVTDATDHGVLLANLARDLGGLDLLIYAAGVMPEVRPNEYDPATDRLIFNVNLLGAVGWLDAVAERFSATRSGTILVLGSVAGDRGRRGQPAYNASKAGLHAFAEALRNRLAPLGVTVTTVKPGPVATPMTQHLGLKGALPVEEAARRILRAAPAGRDVYLKPAHRLVFGVIRLLPSWIMRRLPI